MNRMFLAILVILASGATVSAQNKKDGPAFGTTRVAVINLGLVFAKYERAATFKKEIDNTVGPLKEEAKKLTDNLKAWESSMQKLELGDAKRKTYEEKMIQARRQLEDLDRTARSRVNKQQETSLLLLWKDVHQAVKDYSGKHNIELVIAYGDPSDKEMSVTFPNVSRKMQAADQGGSIPFFVSPRADISEAVANLLNQKYRASQAKPVDLE